PDEPFAPLRLDVQARALLERAKSVRELNDRTFAAAENLIDEGRGTAEAVSAELRTLREEVLLLAGAGELPARNVGNLGFLLYTDHLLAVEPAGPLLLVAAIGAIAIAHRREAVQ